MSPSALYTYGWEWQLERINSMNEAPVQNSGEQGYFGGGYTSEFGTTRVVQREIPVVPPISIAGLSHAHLGGFSLGNEPAVEFNNPTQNGMKRMLRDITRSQGYQRVTAFGQAGLGPHTQQAIGNSYAHPMIPADRAYTTWTRLFDLDTDTPTQTDYLDEVPPTGGEYDVPSADHSYLANKALWDEYFFSSIAPQFPQIPLFANGRSAQTVAADFFFNGADLPNRRFLPYTDSLTEGDLDSLYASDAFTDGGLADSLAAYMMTNGPFNVNSTSVAAWKALLTSHRQQVIHYYEGGALPSSSTAPEIPIGFGMMTNGQPIDGVDAANPWNQAQWLSWRNISDEEIDQLAQAIVFQVKTRGPFLSLSEFINRRLDSSDVALSLKGAIQAALDFEGHGDTPAVTINEVFRTSQRLLDGEITTEMRNEANFPEAYEGPAAYGSSAYVDQADLLRGFAGQLTPRGDTFIIRTYGDSLDASGNVQARAWCEAVVQRFPDYIDETQDEPHTKSSELTSPANRDFGRKLRIISFRWLNDSEI